MNYRNAKYLADGRIDCELEHEVHGWIPYTIDPDDDDETVDNVALLADIGSDVAPYVAATQAEIDAEAAAAEASRIAMIEQEFDNQFSVNKVLLKIGFLQENRIRVLEGKPKITTQQFRNWVGRQIE